MDAYGYCFNNPINLVDINGKAPDDWRNGAGQQIFNPKANGGKGAYTKFATAQDIKFGDALRNSGETGAKQFNKLVNSKTQITVEFGGNNNSESIGYVLGLADTGKNSANYTEKADGSIDLKKANIQVFTEGISEFVDDINSGKVNPKDFSGRQKNDIELIKNKKMSFFDVAVSIFGHEIEHAADPANVTILTNEVRGTPIQGTDSEFIPRKIGNEILKDISNK